MFSIFKGKAESKELEIDAHAHFLPETYLKAWKKHGIDPTRGIKLPSWIPEAHLEFMQEWKIDVSILSCLAETAFTLATRARQTILQERSMKSELAWFVSTLDSSVFTTSFRFPVSKSHSLKSA